VFAEVPAPMLARLESSLPRGAEWRYEPKLDGFRGLLWRSANGHVRLLSRNLKDLAPSFPELVRAGVFLPEDTVLDGEIVIADDKGCADFGALQQRLVVGHRAASQVALGQPAVLLAFDVVRRGGTDLTSYPLRVRRTTLEALLAQNVPCLQLIAQTQLVEEAEEWLELLPSIEGVVAKRADGRYLAGQREWIKVKRRRTVDCVVIGVAGDVTHPWLVLGLRHADGEYHHAGLARCSKGMLGRELTSILAEAFARPEEGPIRSRWQHAAVPIWHRVPPRLVCEVAYSTLDSKRWLRQPGRFLRWRTDRSPEDCWLEQLAQG
jgi:ATP-dependent DNA ligase